MQMTTMSRALMSVTLVCGALLLAACGDDAVSPAAKASAAGEAAGASASAGAASAAATAAASASAEVSTVTDLAGTSWNLTAYADSSGSPYPASSAPNLGTISFAADGSFAGSTGCNRLAGTYTIDGANLTLKPGPMTKMACPPDLQAQEDAVVAALPMVATFTANETLELLSADGVSLLMYEPGTLGLEGTSWQATGINNGKEAVVSEAGVEKITMAFGLDGNVAGNSGCNNYSAPYTVTDPDGLTFGPAALTMKACDDAEMKIEKAFTTALGKVATYAIEGSTLTLRDDTGATQLTLTQTIQ